MHDIVDPARELVRAGQPEHGDRSASTWPTGRPAAGIPIFTSGDETHRHPPRIIARSFEEWLLELLRQGGREYWFDPGSTDLGDPWAAHRRHTPQPELPDSAPPVRRRSPSAGGPRGADDREIAAAGPQPARCGADHSTSSARPAVPSPRVSRRRPRSSRIGPRGIRRGHAAWFLNYRRIAELAGGWLVPAGGARSPAAASRT